MIMTLSEFVSAYIEEHNMSKRQFAAMTKISVQQISNIIKGIGNNGKPMSSTMTTYAKIANAVGMDEKEFMLMLNDDVTINPAEATNDVISLPVVGDVKAGYDRNAVQEWEDRIDIPQSWLKGRPAEDYFVLRVFGDSMFPMYQEGDMVLVLRQTTMDHSGQIGVVMYDDDKATIKRVEYVMGEDWMKLSPVNPQYPPIMIRNEALEHCRVLGIPKMLIRQIQ